MAVLSEFATALREAGVKVGRAAREISHVEEERQSWVQRFIIAEIGQRARTRGPDYWDRIFPRLAPEQRAEARIRRMLTRATVANVTAAASASTAEVVSIVTEGTAALLALPLGIISLGTEMLYTTALQIDLAYDLASIYGVPFAGDDVGEISTLLAMPYGVELVTEPSQHDHAPPDEDGTKPWRVIRQMQRDDFAQELGSKLLQQTVLRNVLPVAGIVVSGIWTQILLRRFARHVDTSMRHRRAVVRACRASDLGGVDDARTILDGAWLLATTCGSIGHTEALAMSTLIDSLPVPERIAVHEASFTDDEEAWHTRVRDLSPAHQETLLKVLMLVASADGELRSHEKRFLRRVAATLGRDVDFEQVERMCQQFRPRGLYAPTTLLRPELTTASA